MVGVRETRRNWVVPELQGKKHRESSLVASWQSTTKADYVPKQNLQPAGRHTASSLDPRKQSDGRGSVRTTPWSTTYQTTHTIGENGYIFLGIPSRFQTRKLTHSAPLETTTTLRASFTGKRSLPSRSTKDYWERTEEYIGPQGEVTGKSSSTHPFYHGRKPTTTTHATHRLLQEEYPSACAPREYFKTDHVLRARPPREPSGTLRTSTTSSDYAWRGSGGSTHSPANLGIPAGVRVSPKGVGKKQLEEW
mmetsp:Transcript_29068/g.69451  ORF Transcript_29068/g.69451 Transcript_29068/m.69451 type:complete len:250 (-) Transcript_29068:74-823(-)